MQLYTYHRSSASYRVRIALAHKGLKVAQLPVHLRRGEQASGDFRRINPQGLVPVLVDGDLVLSQSLAILEYLEETHPTPPLLPAAPAERARVRSLALIVCCEIHPLQNMGVQRHLIDALGASEEAARAWARHFIERGLAAFQAALGDGSGRFCHGDAPSLADVCLVPQLYNAVRFGCDLSGLGRLCEIRDACLSLPAFSEAAPESQPDHEP